MKLSLVKILTLIAETTSLREFCIQSLQTDGGSNFYSRVQIKLYSIIVHALCKIPEREVTTNILVH